MRFVVGRGDVAFVGYRVEIHLSRRNETLHEWVRGRGVMERLRLMRGRFRRNLRP